MNEFTSLIRLPIEGESNKPITLTAYVEVLRRATKGQLPSLEDAPKSEWRLIKELKEAGLLSDARTLNVVMPIIITPAGVIALTEWSEFLRKESFWYKIGDTLIRFLWTIVGALCAILPEIIRALS